jgi:phage-related protein
VPDTARDDYDALPEEVRIEADFATTELQNGRHWDGLVSLKGKLAGISEVKIDHDTNTFRVFYVIKFRYCLYIIDAFMKKSKKGKQLNRMDEARLEKRRGTAEAHYRANEDYFKQEFERRRAARIGRDAQRKQAAKPRTSPRKPSPSRKRP